MLIAYEDVESRNSALRLCDRIFQKFQGDLDFQADWWAFKYLEAPEFGEKAAGAAANSDLLIVSADSQGDFPVQIKHWFERWLVKLAKRKQPDAALVSLVLPVAVHQSRAKGEYLQNLARRANLDYLTLDGSEPQSTTGAADGAALNQASSGEAAEHRYHIPDWGINE